MIMESFPQVMINVKIGANGKEVWKTIVVLQT